MHALNKGMNDTAIYGKTKVQLLSTEFFGISEKFMEEVVLVLLLTFELKFPDP